MRKENINNGMITLTLPEGFHVMTKEEMVSFNGKDVKNNWAAKEEERHLVYNIVWNKVPFLTAGVSVEQMLSTIELQ